jgi:hypothetical protein
LLGNEVSIILLEKRGLILGIFRDTDNKRSKIPLATFGVWFPVPKNSAIKGYTILSPNPLLKKNMRNMILIGY